MASSRSRRSDATHAANATDAPPPGPQAPTQPCLLHRLPAELVKDILELSIESEDLAPYPHQQRTFELAGSVCRLWHDLLAHPQAYVATDVSMAIRLADKLKQYGTGRSVRKLGIDYGTKIWVKGSRVVAGSAISRLLDECPRLLELILVGPYSTISVAMNTRLPACAQLERLELALSEDFIEGSDDLQSFESMVERCPHLTHLDTGRLEYKRVNFNPFPHSSVHNHLSTLEIPLSTSNLSLCSALISSSSATLTTLRFTSWSWNLTVALVVAAVAPVAHNLEEFSWKPYDNDVTQSAHLTFLTHLKRLRVLKTGGYNVTRMLEADALQPHPTIERLTIDIRGVAIWGHSNSVARVVAFLASPSSQALTFLCLEDIDYYSAWERLHISASEADKAILVAAGLAHGVEVVLSMKEWGAV